jgi:hypothetical protein
MQPAPSSLKAMQIETYPRQPAADERDPYVDVAHWMRELGSRTCRARPSALPPVTLARREAAPAPWWRGAPALASLAAAYLQYFFVDVHVQIGSIQSLIVFVFPRLT